MANVKTGDLFITAIHVVVRLPRYDRMRVPAGKCEARQLGGCSMQGHRKRTTRHRHFRGNMTSLSFDRSKNFRFLEH